MALSPYSSSRSPQGEVVGKATDPNGHLDRAAYAAMRERLRAFSPEWWVYELEEELEGRRGVVQLFEDYHEGRHLLAFASSKYRETFAEMLAAVSDNWLPLVIESTVERLHIRSFHFGGEKQADEDAMALWRENHLDEDGQLAWTESSKHGESYLLVWPEPVSTPGFFSRLVGRRGEERARITVEHPGQVVVRREAGDRRRRAAAMKKWREDDGRLLATVYLPDGIYRFEREDAEGARWKARRGEPFSDPNPFGVVPVLPIVTNPQLRPARPPTAMLAAPHRVPNAAIGYGRSDLADVISTQDQINKLVSDMLVASEYAGFRQRWATGLQVPDAEGEDVEAPFKAAIDRLWVGTSKDTQFGEFSETQLSNFIEAIGNRVESLAARSRTPPHYLLARLINVNARALEVAETGLGAKANKRTSGYGGSALEAVRLGFEVQGDERARAEGSVSWEQTAARSEAEHTDALVKKLALGIPKEQLWRDAGYSDDQIQSFRGMLREQAALERLSAPPPLPPEQPPELPPGPGPEPPPAEPGA